MPADPADRLNDLLPYVHRLRDSSLGEPLRALLRVVNEQVDVIEEDIRRLYDNWFIETCEDWVVPYLADLIGHQPLRSGAADGPADRILSARRDVANTIANRQRKGTVALLEQIAADVGRWPARAVEFYAHLALFQQVRLYGNGVLSDQRRLERGRTVDIRAGDAVDRIGGAFDELAHTVSVGRVTSTRTPRRHNIPSIGLFIWRLPGFPVTKAPAYCIDRARGRYTFSVLGNDSPLVARPLPEPAPTHIADETNVPEFIRRRAFDERALHYYGPARSLFVWRDADRKPVPVKDVVAADLSAWAYKPRGAEVAIDPVLGRIAFSPEEAPEAGVWVSYSYAFPDRLGGGEYSRPGRGLAGSAIYRVGGSADYATLMAAVRAWEQDKQNNPDNPGRGHAVIEICDSGIYEEPIEISLVSGDRLELRAAPLTRPVLRLQNWKTNMPDSMYIHGVPLTEENCSKDAAQAGGQAPRVLLEGLLITGRGVRITGSIGEVRVRHCTLVPGWSIGQDCAPASETEPSIELAETVADLFLDHSIAGTVLIRENRLDTEPVTVAVSGSVLDATRLGNHALSGPEGQPALARLTVERSTILGDVCVQALDLGEDSIFAAGIQVTRRGSGCMRFSYIPPGSRTPRRFQCQPDLVLAAIRQRVDQGLLDPADVPRLEERERSRVQPLFESMRYGTPTYGRLAKGCPAEIGEGAHDESEMGVFHDLFQPQRLSNLRTRLDQYTPASMDSGIIFIT